MRFSFTARWQSRGLLFRSKIAKKHFKLTLQPRNATPNSIQHEFPVNSEVDVHQEISHSAGATPFDLRMSVTEFYRELLDCFTQFG